MYKILRFLIIAAIAGGVAYFYRAEIKDVSSQLYARFLPCSRPISYSIVTFDTRFGISKQDFLKAVGQAEAVWEKSAGKELFAYEQSGGTLKVNLVYDYRQEATQKLRALGFTVDSSRVSYDALRQKYLSLRTKHETDSKLFDERAASLEARQAEYNKQVAYWNSRRGAPKDEYARLNAEKSALEAEFTQVKQLEDAANAEVDEINALVVVLNRLAKALNVDVAQYNEIGASRGAEFEEGLYESSATGQKIDIYEFDDRGKLVRVLAHELGHALGLLHISDRNAIMYELNQGENQTPTKADIAELNRVCGK